MARRTQARKTKQQIDTEQKEQILGKLEKADELVVQVQKVMNVLERIAGMRSKTLEDNLISQPESKGEETEIVKRIDKGKSKEVVEKEYDNKWFKMDIEDGGDKNSQ